MFWVLVIFFYCEALWYKLKLSRFPFVLNDPCVGLFQPEAFYDSIMAMQSLVHTEVSENSAMIYDYEFPSY